MPLIQSRSPPAVASQIESRSTPGTSLNRSFSERSLESRVRVHCVAIERQRKRNGLFDSLQVAQHGLAATVDKLGVGVELAGDHFELGHRRQRFAGEDAAGELQPADRVREGHDAGRTGRFEVAVSETGNLRSGIDEGHRQDQRAAGRGSKQRRLGLLDASGDGTLAPRLDLFDAAKCRTVIENLLVDRLGLPRGRTSGRARESRDAERLGKFAEFDRGRGNLVLRVTIGFEQPGVDGLIVHQPSDGSHAARLTRERQPARRR